eukprot:TRINITY_DN6590_c0_g1_i1.p1 TRINITY_DN6590_c0_g1~~TRINITY_DN6590_c0_g1_i1.p1  ORF type:complete len:1319 (+),score=306.15 TRINITY_DN6590_c0_g1_i1:294-3959(+)
MTWQEGHLWQATVLLDLPLGSMLRYKYFVGTDGYMPTATRWEGGQDRYWEPTPPSPRGPAPPPLIVAAAVPADDICRGTLVCDRWDFPHDTVVRHFPETWTRTVVAVMRWSLGDLNGAAARLEAVVRQDPTFIPAFVALFCAAGLRKEWRLRAHAHRRAREVVDALYRQRLDDAVLRDFWLLLQTAVGTDSSALYSLIRGHCCWLFEERNPRPNFSLLLELLGEAASKGDVQAECLLGYIHFYGHAGMPPDLVKAYTYLLSASQKQYAVAQHYFGHLYFGKSKQDYQQMHLWLQRAVDQRLPAALYTKGLCYQDGIGVERNLEESRRLLREAADLDHGEAEFALGDIYLYGRGTAQDKREGARWYKRAAEGGIIEAQLKLAWCYDTGDGVRHSPEKAARWYLKAAEGNCVCAQYNIGVCYILGYGIACDPQKALTWWNQASLAGFAPATLAFALTTERRPQLAADFPEATSHLNSPGVAYQIGAKSGIPFAMRKLSRFLMRQATRQTTAAEAVSYAIRAAQSSRFSETNFAKVYPPPASIYVGQTKLVCWTAYNTVPSRLPLSCETCGALLVDTLPHVCLPAAAVRKPCPYLRLASRGSDLYVETRVVLVRFDCRDARSELVCWLPTPLTCFTASDAMLVTGFTGAALWQRCFVVGDKTVDQFLPHEATQVSCKEDQLMLVSRNGFAFHATAAPPTAAEAAAAAAAPVDIPDDMPMGVATPAVEAQLSAPVLSLACKQVTAMCCGLHFVILATHDCMTYSWGRNDKGQLGLGFCSGEVQHPQEIPALMGVSLVALSAGTEHTIAVSRSDVYSWGANDCGQLGIDSTEPRGDPMVIPALRTVAACACTCYGAMSSVLTRGGDVYAWGILQSSSPAARSATPQRLLLDPALRATAVTCSLNGVFAIVAPRVVGSAEATATAEALPIQPVLGETPVIADASVGSPHPRGNAYQALKFSMAYLPIAHITNFALACHACHQMVRDVVACNDFWKAQYRGAFRKLYLYKPIRDWRCAYFEMRRVFVSLAETEEVVWASLAPLINGYFALPALKAAGRGVLLARMSDFAAKRTWVLYHYLVDALSTVLPMRLARTRQCFALFLDQCDHSLQNARLFLHHCCSLWDDCCEAVRTVSAVFGEGMQQIRPSALPMVSGELMELGWTVFVFAPLQTHIRLCLKILEPCKDAHPAIQTLRVLLDKVDDATDMCGAPWCMPAILSAFEKRKHAD